ncbi:MAG TPA: type I phosphomannose isomerase catalytic subunit [Candidatus Limnocylindria bacterium]|nr:type I phosphomannose isomerase catalytic subunit [Candidatus Limnocylindria bacterium]
MTKLYPLTFEPIFKERVWGGRNIERLYEKKLPPNQVIGESWEITDRPEGISVIANGEFAGKSLRWLMENHAAELLGTGRADAKQFPLLVKILDAQDKLSLQVHPPAALAKELKGEPKTEMWFIADATSAADLFVGLKRGVTRAQFEEKVRDGSVAECFHHLPVKNGDTMFLPSGRVHAIGAGNVIFEIQQNSDTTYRVFDWNRVGLDGKPRELHVEQSLASIDFNDFEPPLIKTEYSRNETFAVRYLVDVPLFRTNAWQIKRGQRFHVSSKLPQIFGIVRGRMTISANGVEAPLKPGDFCLVPAAVKRITIQSETQVELLHVEF